MKVRILALAICLIAGCKPPVMELNAPIHTVEIEGCQYILMKAPEGDFGWVMAHKGNCINSIHQ